MFFYEILHRGKKEVVSIVIITHSLARLSHKTIITMNLKIKGKMVEKKKSFKMRL